MRRRTTPTTSTADGSLLNVGGLGLDDLIVDAQISIPDVLILMLVDHRPVAYAKIPIAEIAFNTNAIKSGVDCGQLKTIYLKWMKHKRHHGKLMEHSLPSVLQARFWFGLSEHRHYFEDAIAPGKLRYYAELFVNEKKGRISGKFAATKDDPYPISDELGTTELSEAAVRPPAGWRFDGDWRQQRTHDMYVGPETGSRRFEDECFERQKQSDEDWIHDGFTTYYGDPIAEKALDDPPPGWVWDGKWEVDLHCEGGVDGWIYSIDSEFSEKAGACDVCERKGHKYRRRRLKRFRLLAKQATMWSMFEDVDLFRKRCDNSGWEYAKSFEKPLHMQQQHDDRVRRKRLLREIVRERANAYKLGVRVNGESISPRIYEVHEQISAFQLRVYCLWGRELVCPSKVITRTFVRVFFLHRCQETAVIKFTTNPIFNETLLFDEILVNGGILSLTKNPPSAVIEVLGETFEGSEVLLGRFELAPVVLSTAQREPPKIRWFALQHTFDAGNGKGALLAYAELYQSDPTKKRLLPKLPILKGTNRFEVPPDFRPNFVKYTVQILCWGMRNLQRFKMSKIRQPWLEISVADLTGQTLPLKDSQTTPNFEDPLITFRDVMMPDKLYYAPPIQIALFDQRTFGMMPQVGVCTISNFSKYLRPPPPVVRDNPEDWIDFNSVVAAEQAIERRQLQNFDSRHQRDSDEFFAFPDDPNSPRIDWWCKYFHSNGEDDKAPGYAELGLNKVLILRQTLENTSDYRGFGDFLDTFYLERHNRKKHRDTNRSKDICGELKGKLFIVKHGAKSVAPLLDQVPGAEFEGVVPCVVRVYVVRALDLVSCNKSGYLDPYVSIHLGSRKMKSPYIADTCNPIFGHMFEITADIPRETTLRISIGDSKRFFGGEQLGETTIDLENRLLTKHRATVGLPLAYNLYGPLPWRDQLPPLDVLGRFCRKMGYPVPKVLKTENDCGLEVLGQAIWLSTLEPKPPLIGHFLGRPIQRVALAALHAIGLVPEHVETRPLASSVNPDVEVGRIECFVDIFPKVLGSIPPPIDISPRKPDNYQLRIVIWRVRNVIFKKRSFLAPSGDLYVRCFFQGTKGERTDIHYRVLDGNGSFNWRFVFNFEFDPWERMMSLKKKTRWFRKASTALVEPVLVVQICDNNKFSRDTVIGEMQLPLLGFEEAQAEDDMVNVRYERRRKLPRCIKQCHWCWKTKCCLLPYDENLLKMPKAPFYVPRKAEVRSLFQQRYARGWWPCTSTNVAESQRCVDKVAKKKKDDDYEELQEGEVQRYVTGIIEMEVGLLTAEDAAKEPVGRKRKKPNRNPFLPKPDRSKWDSNWCLSRCRTCTAFWWKTVGPQTVCWSIAIIILITIIVVVIYRFPDIVIMASTASVNLFTKIVTRSNSND
uniref:C2 domain-containing protein n=1 Tax=Panagrellus redivivus TaxID=6233 RepID=A0A7E4VFY6_PANRE